MVFAPRWKRTIGTLLDAIVGTLPFALVTVLALSGMITSTMYTASVGWSVLYFFFADGLHSGQSFGKRLMGMRVVQLDGKSPCSFGQAFVRKLPLAILGPVDWLFIYGKDHQRLGDKVAGTYVVPD